MTEQSPYREHQMPDDEDDTPAPWRPGVKREDWTAGGGEAHDPDYGRSGAGPEHPAAPEEPFRRHASPPPPYAAPPPLPPPPRPWWEQALARANSTFGLTAIAVVAVAGILVFAFTRPKQPTVSVTSIRHNAARFDGRTVTVHGRVGEVYRVGRGYSFYLMQGRDTLVVFTRMRVPVTNQKVAVTGVVSSAVLRGQMHEALLESAPEGGP